MPSTSTQGGSQLDGLDMLGIQMTKEIASIASEPVYQEEIAYSGSGGPMEVFDFDSQTNGFQESLGALLALQNPSYWNNMMMPGYVYKTFARVCVGSP